ncbi:MAG TPA: type II secretion system minor pseudopilin GspK [Nevskiaceae bacterium]
MSCFTAPREAQRGVALITAIFVVALAAIAATALLTTTGIAVQRTASLQDSEDAWWYASGLEDWVAGQLQRRNGQAEVDSLGQPWAQPITNMAYDRGVVSGRLVDLQGLFNLNNLATQGKDLEAYQQQFRLLVASIPGVDPATTGLLAEHISAWLSPTTGASQPADAALYLALNPPYRPAGQLFRSPRGLLAVAGVTPALFQALHPYVATLPQTGTRINVNTAPLPVLLSLAADVNAGRLADFVASRIRAPATSVAELYDPQHDLLPASVPRGRVDVQTSFLQMQARIAVGSSRLDLYSDIHRSGRTMPVVYARSTGTD